MSLRRYLAATLLVLFCHAGLCALVGRAALAHPVAQGQIDLVIYADRISLFIRSSVEEVTVSTTLRVEEKTDAYAPAALAGYASENRCDFGR